MSIQSEIDRINAAVTSQTDLIARIQTALEGKAAGGGDSGGGVETCTVTFYGDNIGEINCTCVQLSADGVVKNAQTYFDSGDSVSVIKNTSLYFYDFQNWLATMDVFEFNVPLDINEITHGGMLEVCIPDDYDDIQITFTL